MQVHNIILDTDYHDCYDFFFLTPSGAKTFNKTNCKIWERKVSRGISREKQWEKLRSLLLPFGEYQSQKQMERYFPSSHIVRLPYTGTCKKLAEMADGWAERDKRPAGDSDGEHPAYKYTAGRELKLVVYTDPMQHGGEGKVLLPAKEAAEKYPDHFCTEYIHTVEIPEGSVSYRRLYIGYYELLLRYENPGEWRTNIVVGDHEVKIELLEMKRLYKDNRPCMDEPLFAIDFVCYEYGCTMYAIDYNVAPGIKGQEVDKILGNEWIAEQLALFVEENL